MIDAFNPQFLIVPVYVVLMLFPFLESDVSIWSVGITFLLVLIAFSTWAASRSPLALAGMSALLLGWSLICVQIVRAMAHV